MAFGAKEGRAVAEGDSSWVLDVMYAVTINTGWHVSIVFFGEGIAMYAILICVVDRAVTTGAGLRNVQAGGD